MKSWNTPVLWNIRPKMPVVCRSLISEKGSTLRNPTISATSAELSALRNTKSLQNLKGQVSHFTGCTFDAAGTPTVEVNAIGASQLTLVKSLSSFSQPTYHI